MSDIKRKIGYLSRQELARLSEKLKEWAVKTPERKIERRRDRFAPCQLSFAQQRLWFLDQLMPNTPLYNCPGVERLNERVDLGILERVINEVVRRHESLRTRFEVEEGEPVQVIDAWGPRRLDLTDLTNLPLEEREAELSRIAGEEANAGFDLSRGPLFRVKVLKLGEDEYLALYTMHHIVSDEWSMGILIREVETLYQAYLAGEESPLAELEIQYADFAVWQREYLAGEALENEVGYWREQLKDVVVLELPTDRARPAEVSYQGGLKRMWLGRQLSEDLKTLSRREGATLYMTLMAAFKALLMRYSGQEDISVGTPIANRMWKEVEGLIGFFVNTLVMRTDLSGNPSFRELVRREREVALGAYAHQELPFEKLVEELNPDRDLSRSPLFQVMLGLQNAEQEISKLNGAVLDGVGSGIEMADVEYAVHFDLTLTIMDTGRGLAGGVEYSRDLFEAETIGRLIEHYTNLLNEIARNSERPISDLGLLSDEERTQVVLGWNETADHYPEDRCVHSLFEEQTERTPEAVAVVSDEGCLSYGELNRRANRLARRLRRLGVGPEAVVGVCLEKSLEMMVGLLGALKAGGAYLPLDPTYPSERLGLMMENTSARLIVTQANLKVLFAERESELICVDGSRDEIGSESEENIDGVASVENLAYVIYTSGSTGVPKGAMITHRSVVNLMSDAVRKFRLGPESRFLQFASLSFDVAVEEIYPVLTIGGSLVLLPDEESYSYSELTSKIERHQVTTVELPTVYWREWMRELLKSGIRAPRCLDLVITGDERITVDVFREWKEHEVSLLHVYGVTECTVNSMVYEVPAEFGEGVNPGAIPIGKPIANVEAYLLDNGLEPTPLRIPGEIYLGGVGVGRGYLRRPEMTAERYVPSPFGKKAGGRLYRSGDLARSSEDGGIEFLGRADTQVKLRGYRIELGEIETQLARHPGIREAVAYVREDNPGDKRLVAYYTVAATDGHVATVEGETLRAYLSTVLPEYMLPGAYVELESLPLTPNGKLDRRALPQPDYAGATHKYEAPVGDIEIALARIWGETLKLDRVGRHDNFFTLGGHSLLAIRLIERMRREGLQIDVRTLFITPTVAGLAAGVEHIKAGKYVDPRGIIQIPPNRIPPDCEAITPEMLPLAQLTQQEIDSIVNGVPGGAPNIQNIYPLGPLQEGMLFHHLLTTEGDVYLTYYLLAFSSRALLDRVLQVLQVVIDRHDILRTSVSWEGLSEPVQVVWRQAPLTVEEVSVEPTADDVAEALYARFGPHGHRLDLRKAPLMRVYIAHDTRKDRWVMLHLFHHLSIDHVGFDVMMEEIQAHMLGRAEQLPAPWPFSNFVAQARMGVSREEHERFFRKMLGDVDEPTAPYGLIDVHGDGSGIEEAVREVDAGLAIRLRQTSRKLEVTAATLCHLAWALVLGRVSGRDDVVFGTVLFGRMQGVEGADRAIGMLLNTLPIRIWLDEKSVEESVQRTHQSLTELMKHEHASLALAQKCSAVEALTPLFSAHLNYRYSMAPETPTEAAEDTFRELEGIDFLKAGDRYVYPLTLNIDDLGEGFALSAHVRSPVDPERICAYMQTALEQLVEALERAPATPARNLDVLPASERRQLLVEWNATEVEYTGDECIHCLFEAQSARTPHAIAVAYEDDQLSYGALNAQANRFARYLRSLSVQPDARVALCMERSLEMIVSLLAILKAGGAYVPLDPAYPTERLVYMLEDSAPVVILTHSHVLAHVQSAIHSTLAAAGVPVIDLLADAAWWSSEPDTDPDLESMGLMPEHLAYVIYTSGSTGHPKGVLVEHRGLSNYLCWARNTYLPEQGAVVSSSLSFDATITSLLTPLICGSQVRLLSEKKEVDGLEEQVRAAQGCGLVKITPVHLDMLGQRLLSEKAGSSVGLFVVGGEALWPSTVELWRQIQPGVRLVNEYGPTETVVGCIVQEIPKDQELGGSIPIGRPIANTRVYVLDRQGQPGPVGMVGEIYIGGAGVARGYLNRPESSAERFLPDPFAVESGAQMGRRIYRTGDLGRYLADGTIEFLGRNDFQVKLRGYRIELGEVEARLAQHPAIREVVVLAREDSPGDKRLVAYYTATEQSATSTELTEAGNAAASRLGADALRAYLSAALPDYMLPAAYVALDAMPLTPNGKLNRQALPAAEGDVYAARGYEAPVGEIETRLARIWAEALKIERVGRSDNFFELGGHSLLAITLVDRMSQEGLHADVGALFTTPTLAALAAVVSDTSGIVDVPPNRIPPDCKAITPEMLPLVELSAADIERIVEAVPGGAANVQDIYPLAPLQEGILFHHLMEAEGDVYLMPTLLSFDSRARLDRFLQSLQAVIDRHDILRTAVLWEGLPEPVQVVWRQAPLAVEEISLDPAAEDIAKQLLARFNPRRYRIDVRRAPLMCVWIAPGAGHDQWVALLLVHHLSNDHTTLNVLLEEVQAHLLGRAELLPAPLPFRNFVAQARLGVSQQEHEAFFREMLADVDAPTTPFGLIDVQGDGSDIRETWREVDAGLASRLRQRARALEVSAASLCHLAWARVLARVSTSASGRDDVVFGTVLFGRMQGGEGADRAPGMFINTLPIRIRVGAESVEESVLQTHRLLAQLLRHEHAPLALAQRCSGVAPPAPLFSAFLSYNYDAVADSVAATSEKAFSAWEGIEFLGNETRSNYPFAFGVDDLGEGFSLNAQVESPIDPDRICAYMHTALERLVEALEHAPATPARSLDVLPASERHQLLIEWNQTGRPYPQDRCAHELLTDQSKLTPERIALIGEWERMSYRELNRRANQLAAYLKRLGVGPEVVVGLCMRRSVEMVVTVLGVLKAGGAYLPLDPEYPLERLSYVLEDAGVGVVLTEQKLDERLPAFWGQTVCLDREWERISEESESEPENESEGENLAYVIYTSGSTGKPKGVMAAHQGLRNLVEAQKEAFRVGDQSRVLQFASLSFDASVWEIFGALAAGGSLHVYARESLMPGDDLERVLREDQITTVTLPPTVLAALGQEELCHLETVIVAGEACGAEIVDRWARGRRFLDAYGPTEATVCASIGECEAGSNRNPTIGRPITNTQLYILDHEVKPVAVGMRGELYIAGAGLARGYFGKPELTAERFLPNSFSQEGGERLYRTGDVGRYLSNGEIEFIGRADEQVKIRGYLVEPREIEIALSEQPGVRQAAVVAREDEPGQKRLVAYIVTDLTAGDNKAAHLDARIYKELFGAESADQLEGGRVAKSVSVDLRRAIERRLPNFMMPSAIVLMDRLPLTSNGKLDRKALPSPELGRAEIEDGYVGARTPVEEIVVGIFKDVLKLDRVGIHDNFFEFGGHSLLATRVISRARNTFGVELEVGSMFEKPTAAGLARRIERAMKSGEKNVAPPLVRVEREGQKGLKLPLSFAQQRLWFIDQLTPNTPLYNTPAAVNLEGRLDVQALERAINEIVRRHEVLRTRIEMEESEPVQVIDAWEHRSLEVTDLTDLIREEREEVVRRMAREEAETGFDLERGPMLRVRVLKLEEEEHVLLYTMHHIISDGWSMGILIREVGTLYQVYSAGEPSPLEELAIQYADFAVWQREWLKGEVLERELEYWRKQLAGMEELELPTDLPRPAKQTHHGAERSHALPTALSDSLKALSLEKSCTLFMTLLAAFKTLLYYLTGQTDIWVGTDIANRNRAETEKLIGFFVNQLVLRAELAPNSTFEELLRKVRDITLEAYAHQDLPFEKLVEALNPKRDSNHTQLFQVKIVLQNAPVEELSLPGLKLNQIGTATGIAKCDLFLDLADTESGLYASLQYNTDLFEERTPTRILNRFQTLLDQIVERPDAKLQELVESLIEEDKREEIEKDRELESNRLRKLKSSKRRVIGETYAEVEQ